GTRYGSGWRHRASPRVQRPRNRRPHRLTWPPPLHSPCRGHRGRRGRDDAIPTVRELLPLGRTAPTSL
ncbi:MAG: hypothetical protein AVDCRST_MAG70-2428, partial [uncultured Thermomicrobiales bacterium]